MYVWKDAVRDLPVYVNSHAQCKTPTSVDL